MVHPFVMLMIDASLVSVLVFKFAHEVFRNQYPTLCRSYYSVSGMTNLVHPICKGATGHYFKGKI